MRIFQRTSRILGRMRDLLTPQTRMTREVPPPTPRVLGQNANPVDGKCLGLPRGWVGEALCVAGQLPKP